MKGLFIAVALLASVSAFCQDDTHIKEIMCIMGASDAESLDEEVIDGFERLATRPLRINLASASEFRASGLFSEYQAASLIDYRQHSGEILSISELALVDGIGKEYAAALTPFISLERRLNPGAREDSSRNLSQSLFVRATLKNGSWVQAGKYRLVGERLELAFAAKNSDAFTYSFSAAISGRRARLIVGDFNARFGQGLSLWNSFSLSGLSGISSFYKRSTGLSPAWSYSSSSLRGLGGELRFGRIKISSFAAFSSLRNWMEGGSWTNTVMPALNVGYFGRHGQVGITAWVECSEGEWTEGRVSADCRFCIKGTEMFAEVSWDPYNECMAGLAGAVIPIGESLKLALLARGYPANFGTSMTGAMRSWTYCRDENSASMGVEFKGWTLTADHAMKAEGSNHSTKLLFYKTLKITPKWSVKPRFSQRFRNYGFTNRTDLRLDICRESATWISTLRLNALTCDKWGFLGYLEQGWKTDKYALYARGVLFRIDDWDDRIYVYERDAPGNYNVTAYYRRGYSLSFNASAKFWMRRSGVGSGIETAGSSRSRLKVYFRAALTSYPWLSPGMTAKKEQSYELKLQAMYDF